MSSTLPFCYLRKIKQDGNFHWVEVLKSIPAVTMWSASSVWSISQAQLVKVLLRCRERGGSLCRVGTNRIKVTEQSWRPNYKGADLKLFWVITQHCYESKIHLQMDFLWKRLCYTETSEQEADNRKQVNNRNAAKMCHLNSKCYWQIKRS